MAKLYSFGEELALKEDVPSEASNFDINTLLDEGINLQNYSISTDPQYDYETVNTYEIEKYNKLLEILGSGASYVGVYIRDRNMQINMGYVESVSSPSMVVKTGDIHYYVEPEIDLEGSIIKISIKEKRYE